MSGSIGLDPVSTYLSITRNETQNVATFAKSDPVTKSDVAYFQAHAARITTPAQLLKDYRSLKVVLGAFNMSDVISQTAVLKDLMTQDPTSTTSLAKRLNNADYTRFAQYMSGWSSASPLSDAGTVQTIVSQYQTNQYTAAEGQHNPGMQQALQFRSTMASGSVTTLQQMMSDPTLLSVVEQATGQPKAFGLLDYDQQVRVLTKAVHVSKLQTTQQIDQFAERYLAMYQENPPATDTLSSMSTLTLFGGSTAGETSPLLTLFGATTASTRLTVGSLFSTIA